MTRDAIGRIGAVAGRLHHDLGVAQHGAGDHAVDGVVFGPQNDLKWRAPVVRVRNWLSVLHAGLFAPGGRSWPLAHELPARLQLVLL